MSKNDGMSIIEFLEARITEDEAGLKAVPFAAQQWDDFDFGGTDDYLRFTMGYGRAVAECAVRRAIIAEHSSVDPCDAHDATFKTITCNTLRALAAVYADHPDYQQEWEV
jgi:Family of unknown function (DUF6221)